MAAQSMTSTDDMTLRQLSQNLSDGWECLATFLNISADEVINLKNDYRSDGTNEQIFQMLMKWKHGFDQELNEDGMKRELVKALTELGRRDLAYKVEQGTLMPREEPVCAKRENVDCLTDRILRKLSASLGRGWEHLAILLGVSSTQVKNLKRDHREIGERIFQMLITWRQANNEDMPVDVLNQALEEIGRKDLAVELMGMIEGPQ